MPSRLLLVTAIALLAVAVLVCAPAGASAHPLGNFTVNHYTRIDVTETGITLYRVLDMAELPALQERQRIDSDDDGAIDAAEAAAYATAKTESIADALRLSLDGEPVALEQASRELTFPDGQGGLSLLRLDVTYRAVLPDGWSDASPAIEFEDRNDADRIGWRELIVRGGPGVELDGSTAPSTDISNELTSYPEDSLSSPLDVRSASFSVRPGAGVPLPVGYSGQDDAVRGNPDGTLAGFTDLLAKDDLSASVIVVALLAAVAFGAYHALTPGHGKTLVAAYLIGSRGTARHALLLGLVVTATHTSSVYIFGFIALYLSQYILPEDLYPWLGLASGGLILIMGLSLLAARLRATGYVRLGIESIRSHFDGVRSSAPALMLAVESAPAAASIGDASTRVAASGAAQHVEHHHNHQQKHSHDESHSHSIGPAHSHRIPGQGGAPVTLRSLVGLGVFGGMIPCPSAIVVMLGAIALHRVAFGLLLIVAFSLGLATVLVAIGFALVYARAISDRVPLLRALSGRAEGNGIAGVAIRVIPLVSAMAVVAAGAVITLRSLAQGAL